MNALCLEDVILYVCTSQLAAVDYKQALSLVTRYKCNFRTHHPTFSLCQSNHPSLSHNPSAIFLTTPFIVCKLFLVNNITDILFTLPGETINQSVYLIKFKLFITLV